MREKGLPLSNPRRRLILELRYSPRNGMYNYYADVIPKEYPFVKPLILFIPGRDKQKGSSN